jgi:hypothetical protein
MALIISNQLSTDGGSTSEAYVNIQRIDIMKGAGLSVFLNLYLNEAARQADPNDVVRSRLVPARLGISIDAVSTDLATDNIYSVAYGKVKEQLEAGGLTVSNQI